MATTIPPNVQSIIHQANISKVRSALNESRRIMNGDESRNTRPYMVSLDRLWASIVKALKLNRTSLDFLKTRELMQHPLTLIASTYNIREISINVKTRKDISRGPLQSYIFISFAVKTLTPKYKASKWVNPLTLSEERPLTFAPRKMAKVHNYFLYSILSSLLFVISLSTSDVLR